MREGVVDAVRSALYDGRLTVGQPLSEAGLAAEMGISRGPVREAMLILVQEGLLTHSPNRGFAVVNFTQEDLRETNELRLPLETTALELARPRVLTADLPRLSELKQEIVDSYRTGDTLLNNRSDMAFHSFIWDLTGNGRLATTLRTLLGPFFAYGSLLRPDPTAGRPDTTAELLDEEHQCFIEFLSGSEERTADACVRLHLGIPASEPRPPHNGYNRTA